MTCKEYYQINKESIKLRRKELYIINKEKILIRNKQWRNNNKKNLKQSSKKQRQQFQQKFEKKFPDGYRLNGNDILIERYKHIIGKKFGRFTVLSFYGVSKHKHSYFNCKCDCGKEGVKISYSNLKAGITKSCGCFKKQLRSLVRYTNHSGWKGCGEMSGLYWRTIIDGAKRRNIELNITIQDAWNKFISQNKKCALSGIDLFFKTDKLKKNTASLDRINSSKGYTIDNIQWVYKDLNIMKQDLSDEEFINWCKLVSDYNK